MRTAQGTTEGELRDAEQVLAEARRKAEEIGARLTAARSPLDLLRIQDEGIQAQEELRRAEERLRQVREEHLRPIREARREQVRAAARKAVEAGEAFLAANTELLRAQLALMEAAGEAQPIWFPGVIPGSARAESLFEHWRTALERDGWL